MAAATIKPTILLVPSSFASSALAYDKVAVELRSHGYHVICIELRTVGPPSTGPAATMEDDAAYIHGIAEKLCDEGKDVVIGMSSYGGVPGTEACKSLVKKERKAEGKKGGVVALVYL